ncbi:cytochrome c3 family protein [Amaricoccus sp.]|uniref:cytochrome c3 family protein n=1 Tax=Amaricoccus sp. TaxID=1872485 RepID=UPI001B6E6ECD|nr:cytochrome c3 family protein [Amaricoccus sp.]MBP7002192.1 cytochrome c3 family protein [Amaricoccus sp.]
MKALVAALALLGLALVAFGPPPPVPRVERAVVAGAGRPILPMRFIHDLGHRGIPCATCHHEFVDRRMGTTCINCHVTDPAVSALLEPQFHDLCRSCHVEKQAAGEPGGPTRSCIACHQPDDQF